MYFLKKIKADKFYITEIIHNKSVINNQILTNRALKSNDLSQQLIIKQNNWVHSTQKKNKKASIEMWENVRLKRKKEKE